MSIPYGYCHCGCGEKTNIAKQSCASKGWTNGEPLKFVIGHSQKGKRRRTWESVLAELDRDAPGGCWLWTGGLKNNGYASVSIGGRRVHVHRLVYERLRGPIPPGLDLHHTCEVPHCANPDHLVPLTRKEHRAAHPPIIPPRWNSWKTHCPQGHPYDTENTLFDSNGWRKCRACRYARNRARCQAAV